MRLSIVNAPRPPVNYPTLPLSERIEAVKSLIGLIEANVINNFERRSREKILSQLRDVLYTLELLMYGD